MSSHLRLALLLSVAALPLAANSASGQTTEFGVRGGVTLATAAGTNAALTDLRYQTRLHVTGFATVPISETSGIQFGAGLAERGTAAEGQEGEVHLDLDYIETPLLAMIGLPMGDAAALSVYAGITLAFAIGCEWRTVEEDDDETTAPCGESGVDLEPFDLGVTVGTGARFPLGSSLRLVFDAMYTHGLLSLDAAGELKNRSVSLSAGFIFPLG